MAEAAADFVDEKSFESQSSALAAHPGALLLDYLRARIPDTAENWQELERWLGVWTARGFGWRSWYSESAHVLDGGLLCWNADRSRAEQYGILVDLPGKACAALAERLIPFFAWCLERGNVTRVDFALDDRRNRLQYGRIMDSYRTGRLVMRWRELREFRTWRDGRVASWTVYVGSRSSGAMLRIYDKAAQQRAAGREIDGTWIRLEMECHSEFADKLSREYFERGSIAIVEQLNRRIRFTERADGDGNRWRWRAADWWIELLGSVQPGQSLLVGELPECTISRLAFYAERQSAPALLTVTKAAGGDLAPILAMLGRAQERLKPKHYAALVMAERRQEMTG